MVLKWSHASDRLSNRRNCSHFFVSSRPRHTRLVSMSGLSVKQVNVAIILCGASYRTIVVSGLRSIELRTAARCCEVRGRNPRNMNEDVGRPDAASAVTAAQGPGIGVTVMPEATAEATISVPGSETHGVPASETRATDLPVARLERRVGMRVR